MGSLACLTACLPACLPTYTSGRPSGPLSENEQLPRNTTYYDAVARPICMASPSLIARARTNAKATEASLAGTILGERCGWQEILSAEVGKEGREELRPLHQPTVRQTVLGQKESRRKGGRVGYLYAVRSVGRSEAAKWQNGSFPPPFPPPFPPNTHCWLAGWLGEYVNGNGRGHGREKWAENGPLLGEAGRADIS